MRLVPMVVIVALTLFIGGDRLLNQSKVTGYAYSCRGAQVVQEVTEHNDQWITITVNGEDTAPSLVPYTVYQSRSPHACGTMSHPIDVTAVLPRLVLS